MAELAGTAASSSATNPAGILRTAPTEEDEDTVASEDGEVEEHNGGGAAKRLEAEQEAGRRPLQVVKDSSRNNNKICLNRMSRGATRGQWSPKYKIFTWSWSSQPFVLYSINSFSSMKPD